MKKFTHVYNNERKLIEPVDESIIYCYLTLKHEIEKLLHFMVHELFGCVRTDDIVLAYPKVNC